MVDDSGFHLSADRVLNLEELKAYLHTIAKFLRVQELAGIERTLDQRDRESQESLDRPLGRMQVLASHSEQLLEVTIIPAVLRSRVKSNFGPRCTQLQCAFSAAESGPAGSGKPRVPGPAPRQDVRTGLTS